ncbi:MAG: DUF4326 domain-containing protein [Verrucomicrobia bacterium]|nr:DUF4326 domain-containing protein [Verrucomicrobiota bacterium]
MSDRLSAPHRFKRSRTKGWRKPLGGVCCDRSSRWGNPFDWQKLGRAEAVKRFEEALRAGRLKFSIADIGRELSGKPLGCYCPLDQPCHVDVLLRCATPPP